MVEATLMAAWERLADETEQGFAWLCEGLDREAPVTFVTNPGNVGDALINLGCYRYLAQHFSRVTICSVGGIPATETVFLAGGGNLIEPLYTAIADFVNDRCSGRQLRFFPSSVKGNVAFLDRIAGRTRMLCREAVSFAHVAGHFPEASVRLGHDAAFALAPQLRAAFGSHIGGFPHAAARFFRGDVERAQDRLGDGDLMARSGGSWADLGAAERAVAEAATILLQYSRIYTDRLHCAILAAMLDRFVVMMANSYYKNRAVFDFSLRQFANVRFEDGSFSPPDASIRPRHGRQPA